MTDVTHLLDTEDALGLAALVAAGDVTALELVDAAIGRIEERNPSLNAVVADRFEQARAEAGEVQAGARSGPLAGVPFVVKDLNCDVAGLPSTKGSRLFADVVAPADSELARRYKAAGLLILGNTNTPEMGKNASTEPLLFGPAHNPWHLGHSPGGSSGGSAACVAGGIVPAGHANDGGGSIRIPASACGLVGLKPTRGRTPSYPQLASPAYPVGIGHAVTRTVRDSAALLDAIAGPLAGDPYASPSAPPEGGYQDALARPTGSLRIGFATVAANGHDAHPAAADAVARTAVLLAGLGHEVHEAAPVYDHATVANVLSVLMGAASAEMVETRLAELGRPLADDDLEPFSLFMHERCLGLGAVDVVRAQQDLERTSRAIAPFFAEHDLWLTPTLGVPTPELGVLDTTVVQAMFTKAARFSEYTSVFNVTGQPAISIPAGFDADGLPVGVQLVGDHGTEALLLQVAAQLEAAAPWPRLAPWPPSD